MDKPHPTSETTGAAASVLALLDRSRHVLVAVFALLVSALLLHTLRGLLAELRLADVVAAVRATPPDALGWAVLATALSFAALSGYDHSALRYAGARVAYRIVAPTSFIAYALGNAIGVGVLTGGAVRMRLYAAAGVEAGLIARAIAFNAVAFGLGIAAVGAVALLWGADAVAPVLHVPALLLRLLAAAVLATVAGLLWLCARSGEYRLFGRVRITLPGFGLAAQQLLFSALDIVGAALVLWVLLPPGAVAFSVFLGFFSIAVLLGVISHVPGGMGVFEAVMLIALSGHVPAEQLAAALVLYRLIYFALPLLLALALLVGFELRQGTGAPVVRAAASLAPLGLAAFTLVVGVMLLLSGATPATDSATAWLAQYVPLSLVEASHFLGSIAGVLLLFVARGMLQRLDAAWWAGLLLALFALVLAIPKGIALSEAVMLTLLAAALALSRRQFTRKASLFAQPFSPGWLLAIAAILAASTALLFFAYRDVEYTHQLWWQFEFDGHAPRSLRAQVAVALVALLLATWRLFRPHAAAPPLPDAAALARAEAIVRQQPSAEAGLALVGDKALLFSKSQRAFVMFGRRARSWIALFDPVGPPEEWSELIWSFLEQARAAGCRAAFYQVRPQHLSLYLDAGLQLYKLGEYAYVPLPDFSLQGKSRAKLRHALSRAEREGLSCEIIPPGAAAAVLPALRAVSDAWLAEQQTAEKGFSLGSFDPAYLRRVPLALVRQHGEIIAFASLLTTKIGLEASVDLMRHRPGVPPGTMDFLFISLIRHFQAQGVQRFGLGMAPLAGMAEHPLASHWHRLGRLLYTRGERFYNFRGLRAFKEKFDPQWEPRYLAAPGGLTPLFVLADVAALIGGGLRGVIAK
ncbi:phosphatidylglycerol lysyltransferase [Fontimonas thermophila]|uniref:Phosphatidylglycerol lysyltransferase n=1 Tax=Fontimonas thermophila TaxID=1076937 RepID=A0A1I2H6C4_9GAMM|nr:bifunctional lysylphosphatidylglycerol flippase/synthetase MprF [Fontimonas thermophila]SFF24326.1 phosphatidylglycerol lysyltransferase [Fontimonas thermophila]